MASLSQKLYGRVRIAKQPITWNFFQLNTGGLFGEDEQGFFAMNDWVVRITEKNNKLYYSARIWRTRNGNWKSCWIFLNHGIGEKFFPLLLDTLQLRPQDVTIDSPKKYTQIMPITGKNYSKKTFQDTQEFWRQYTLDVFSAYKKELQNKINSDIKEKYKKIFQEGVLCEGFSAL